MIAMGWTTRRLAVALLAAVGVWPAPAQQDALLPDSDAMALYSRLVQLMESTTTTVPGFARAGAPVIENTRQALGNLQAAASRQDGSLHYSFLNNVRAFLALADAMPKPYPFPEEARRQFRELRESAERADSHFAALLRLKETQLRSPDRDQLTRYQEANLKVPPPKPGRSRVVFFGDSITDGWPLNEYYPDKDYINRGISGQITSQMLARMQADVIALKPAAMVILAGTNDIARGVPVEAIQNNLIMITALAEAHKIRPVIATVLPTHDYNKGQNPAWEMTKRRPLDLIRKLNTWMVAFCQNHNYVCLDYFSSMLDVDGFLKKELADDGLHPNAAGYRVMAPLAQSALDKVLSPAEPEKKKRRFPF
ncbi:MAG: SGNH/GDSL hydrolase family protein [Acidobacteriia bacterium]|nr:SGNH/GDSL hydrolase family protein [Terriglobia bacterium]